MINAIKLAVKKINKKSNSNYREELFDELKHYVKDNTIKEPEAYLEKPINVEEFIQNVNHHLEN